MKLVNKTTPVEFTALSMKTFPSYVNLIHFMWEMSNKDHVWCGCRDRVDGVVQMGRSLRVASSRSQVSTLMIIPGALGLNGSESNIPFTLMTCLEKLVPPLKSISISGMNEILFVLKNVNLPKKKKKCVK